jgi:hypothetical protein
MESSEGSLEKIRPRPRGSTSFALKKYLIPGGLFGPLMNCRIFM